MPGRPTVGRVEYDHVPAERPVDIGAKVRDDESVRVPDEKCARQLVRRRLDWSTDIAVSQPGRELVIGSR